MLQYENLAAEILDRDDGSARDINFDRLNWQGAAAMIQLLLDESSAASATDGDGRSLDMASMNAVDLCNHAQKKRSCHLLLNHAIDLFGNLQVFLCPEDDGSAFVELTFFPDDLLHTFTPRKLIESLIRLATIGGAEDFFLRYENASWEFGTTGHGTGVITTWRDIRNSTSPGTTH